MSHIARIDLIVKDLDALDRACKKIGATLVRDAKQYIWYAGQKKRCDAAIRIPGCSYEVGVIKGGDVNNPSYSLEADFWSSGGLTQKIGRDAGLLKQHYGVELARKHYESQGYMLQVETKENGELVVTASRG